MLVKALKIIRKSSSKKGMALTEIMVATAILSVITIGLTNIFLSSQKSFYYIEGSTNNIQEARSSSEKVSRDLRSTIEIKVANKTSFDFTGDYNGDGLSDRVKYSLVSGTLNRYLLNSDGSTRSVSAVARGVTNNSYQPLFMYYDQNGNVVADTSPADGTPDDLSLIKLVEFDVSIDRETSKSPNRSTNIDTRIQLRNLHERR